MGFWDTGELQTVPYILGTAHPTGYPAFILLGALFSHVIVVGTVAWRMALFCSLCYAAAATVLWSAVVAVTADGVAAIASALLYAFAPIVWRYATHTDAFAVNVLFAALAFRGLIAWRRDGASRPLLLAAIALGLALCAHLTALWLLPGIALLIVASRRMARPRDLPSALLVCAATLLVYAYVPVASAVNHALRRDPTLALGAPPCRPFFDYAHTSNLHNLVWFITGARVAAPTALVSSVGVLAHPAAMVGAVSAFAAMFPAPLMAFAAIACVDVVLLRRQRAVVGAALLCALGAAPFSIAFSGESDPLRYWLVPAWFFALLGGMGIAATLRALAPVTRPVVARASFAVLCAALVAVLQFHGRALYAQPGDHLGRSYVARVRAATADGAVLIVPWVAATPLAYAAYVEAGMGRRIVETATLDDDRDYVPHWLQRRPVYVIAYRRPDVRGIVLGSPQRLFVSPRPETDAWLWPVRSAPSTPMPPADPAGNC